MNITNLTPLANETTAAQKVTRLTGLIEVADPEYRAYIYSGATADEQLARAMGFAFDFFQIP